MFERGSCNECVIFSGPGLCNEFVAWYFPMENKGSDFVDLRARFNGIAYCADFQRSIWFPGLFRNINL